VFGADLTGVIPLGSERSVALDLRLRWLHEDAVVGRPIIAGAPSNAWPEPKSSPRYRP